MKLYTEKVETAACPTRTVAVDDMILTKDIPTTAGSRVLDGYVSLFGAEVLSRLTDAGYALGGKADVGEFAIDLVGETSYNGANVRGGVLLNPTAEILTKKEAVAAINLDVNGSVRRAAAQNGLVSIKPTYGTVSRYGVIPVACSGETVSVMAEKADTCAEILNVIVGHDDKDGTSLSEELCARLRADASVTPIRKVALLTSMTKDVDASVHAKLSSCKELLSAAGIEVSTLDDEVISAARAAWNVLMSAELCNNVSRYDGVKYGYRSENFKNIDELYTNSRTEAFGGLLKSAILFGSDTLSTENYMKAYDKSLRVRRVICERFAEIFARYDALVLPACSFMEYTEDMISKNQYMVYEENAYTAPASITGLPAVVAGGVQFVGPAFSDKALLSLAKLFEKEGA